MTRAKPKKIKRHLYPTSNCQHIYFSALIFFGVIWSERKTIYDDRGQTLINELTMKIYRNFVREYNYKESEIKNKWKTSSTPN